MISVIQATDSTCIGYNPKIVAATPDVGTQTTGGPIYLGVEEVIAVLCSAPKNLFLKKDVTNHHYQQKQTYGNKQVSPPTRWPSYLSKSHVAQDSATTPGHLT